METKILAHIERITAINPIINKKGETMNNVSAQVLGWWCMVKPDQFKVGQLVIYVEVGSVLPDKLEYEFLRKYDFRIKTQQYFGGSYVSQGLILPIPDNWKYFSDRRCFEGTNVTNLLGITKYYTKDELNEEKVSFKIKHWTKNYKFTNYFWKYKWFRNIFLPKILDDSFTDKVGKTDEPKIQNLPQILEQFKDKEVYVTEKVDYSSGTFTMELVQRFKIFKKLFTKQELQVFSREKRRFDKDSVWWKVANKYNLEAILKENPNLVIQGEQGDTKVQGNKYGITEPTMWVFNIIDHEKNYHYNYLEMWEFCEKYKLNVVPLIHKHISKLYADYSQMPTRFAEKHTCKLSELGSTVQELVEFSKGKSIINPNIEREGIVVRCIENGKKILSFKVINPDFQLKYNL